MISVGILVGEKMATKTPKDFSHESLRCSWPIDFTKRRKFNRDSENQPYIEYLEQRRYLGEEDVDDDEEEEEDEEGEDDDGDSVLSEDDQPSNAPEDEIEGNEDDKLDLGNITDDGHPMSNVRRFMKGMTGDEESLENYDLVDEVANFCEKGSVGGVQKKYVAIIDERNHYGTIVDKRGHCRTNLKPLTLEQMRDKLSKKVTQFSC
jgi:hypothetical protein